MKTLKINQPAVWILVLIHQIIGAIWFSPVAFARKWIEYTGKAMSDFENAGFTPYIISIIGAVIMVYAMAWLFTKLNVENFVSGMMYAFVLWFGFFFFELMTFNAFELRPYGMTFIDGGKSLVTFLITGFVLGTWRKYNETPVKNPENV